MWKRLLDRMSLDYADWFALLLSVLLAAAVYLGYQIGSAPVPPLTCACACPEVHDAP